MNRMLFVSKKETVEEHPTILERKGIEPYNGHVIHGKYWHDVE